MLYEKKEYLEVNSEYDDDSISIWLRGKRYRIVFPEEVWKPLERPVKESIVDHVAFMATNYLPLVLGKKGVVYDTRLPMFDCFSFKSMVMDLPSGAVLDRGSTVDYLRSYMNLDFVFAPGEPVVWSRPFEPEERALIAFTSGKESLLTLALCLELGIEPVLVNVVEPSNTNEHRHKAEILRRLEEEFGVEYHIVPQEPGLFHDAGHMSSRLSSLGWGNQLMYYLFIFIPFVIHHRARYVLYGNEKSCDFESVNRESFRTNFCYDQSSHWTIQQDVVLRTLTGGSARVGSLVGPLNEIAVARCLHQGFPELAKYQMSCFCEDPVTVEQRWCCNCSKCARNYAFLRALDVDPEKVGFWCDMLTEEHAGLFPALGGVETYGFDRSGLGREEQELALRLAYENERGNKLLRGFMEDCGPDVNGGDDEPQPPSMKASHDYYFGIHDYPAMPGELKEGVLRIFSRILNGKSS